MWFGSRVRILLGALLRNPLLPVNMLVGGGFYVLVYAVEYGGLRSFTVSHVVELHWLFSASCLLQQQDGVLALHATVAG